MFTRMPEALHLLIEEARRRTVDPLRKRSALNMSPAEYGIELNTVALNMGRVSGHTSYIKNRAHKREDLIIVHSNGMLQDYQDAGFQNVYRPQEVIRLGHPWFRSTVWIDEPALVFKEVSQYNLYEVLCNIKHIPIFVQLGRAI